MRTSPSRSFNMSRIRGKDTGPELVVRRWLHARGFRYSLNVRRLPGSPDIVLAKYRTCIFVNGCFWHGHRGCRYATRPKSNAEFWKAKICNNIRRDELAVQALEAMGWKVITVWECELRKGRREDTLPSLAEQIRLNGAAYASEQAQRRLRNAEHRAMLKAAQERYEAAMKELSTGNRK